MENPPGQCVRDRKDKKRRMAAVDKHHRCNSVRHTKHQQKVARPEQVHVRENHIISMEQAMMQVMRVSSRRVRAGRFGTGLLL